MRSDDHIYEIRLGRGYPLLGSLPYSFKRVARDLLRAMSQTQGIKHLAFDDLVGTTG